MLFFALVYVVEGIGQTGGLIAQPLNYFLKQTYGWTPVQVTAYLTVLNLPWIIKPVYGIVSDFLPLFGYRRKIVPRSRQFDGGGRLLLGDADHLAGRNHCRPAALRLRDGDIEHRVRRYSRRERPKIQRQRFLRQSAVAVVQHRRNGLRLYRRSAGREAVAGWGAARRCRDHRRRPADRRLCRRRF